MVQGRREVGYLQLVWYTISVGFHLRRLRLVQRLLNSNSTELAMALLVLQVWDLHTPYLLLRSDKMLYHL
jgi:hypothetical protein